jgi:hypothetical protein
MRTVSGNSTVVRCEFEHPRPKQAAALNGNNVIFYIEV